MDTDTLQWEAVDNPSREDVTIVDDGLDSHNGKAADFSGVEPFACFARTPDGRIIGGVLARRWGKCCEMQQLWVDDAHRSHGIGGKLVELMEEHARSHGCSLAYLETFSFQAPVFYRALGYEDACEFQGFPDGISKFIMRKSL